MKTVKKVATLPFRHSKRDEKASEHPKQTENEASTTNTASTIPTMATPQQLQGKVALVTGGSKGIGRATCLALAKAGASVVINYSSDSSSADSLVQEIGSEKAVAVKADAGSVVGAEEMVKQTIDRFRKLDVLVANAGK